MQSTLQCSFDLFILWDSFIDTLNLHTCLDHTNMNWQQNGTMMFVRMLVPYVNCLLTACPLTSKLKAFPWFWVEEMYLWLLKLVAARLEWVLWLILSNHRFCLLSWDSLPSLSRHFAYQWFKLCMRQWKIYRKVKAKGQRIPELVKVSN